MDTQNPEVTVLMPVYNGERYLREAIESILRQTFTDFEFLIIDDGSTDGSAATVKGYNDGRIRLVENEQNIGLTRSLNRGLHLARGEYIARMDADDISLPERLAEQARHLDQHPEVAVATSGWELIDECGQSLARHSHPLSSEEIYYFLTFFNCVHHSSVLFRKDFVMRLGGYDEAVKYSQDYDLWLKVSRLAKIAMSKKVLTRFRLSESSVSSRFKADSINHSDMIFAKHLTGLTGGEVSTANILHFRLRMLDRRKAPITYDDLCELEKVHQKLILACPPSLDSHKLEAYCDLQLQYHLGSLLRRPQLNNIRRIGRNPRFRKALFCILKRRATSLVSIHSYS